VLKDLSNGVTVVVVEARRFGHGGLQASHCGFGLPSQVGRDARTFRQHTSDDNPRASTATADSGRAQSGIPAVSHK
jgi:hypothetical protein